MLYSVYETFFNTTISSYSPRISVCSFKLSNFYSPAVTMTANAVLKTLFFFAPFGKVFSYILYYIYIY